MNWEMLYNRMVEVYKLTIRLLLVLQFVSQLALIAPIPDLLSDLLDGHSLSEGLSGCIRMVCTR